MKLAAVYFAVLIFSFADARITFGQTGSNETFIRPSDANGEDTVKDLEIIAGDAVNTGERLFVIARAGKLEKSNRINPARLAYAKMFLLRIRRFPFQEPVFAEGERVDGEGRLKFYLGSRLRLVTLAKRNKIPNLTCCRDYFPPVRNKPRRKRKT